MTTNLHGERAGAAVRLAARRSGLRWSSPRPSGFTLIEIVLVLTLLSLLAAAAVPSVRGLQEEQAAREPLAALAKLAKETRLKAMRDKRPYQIVFTSKGFTATRYLSPYLQLAQLDEFIQRTELEAQQKAEAGLTEEPAPPLGNSTTTTAPPAPAFKDWTETYALPEGTACGVQLWHELEPLAIEGEMVRLWVFQPTGIVTPLAVSITHAGHTFTASFSALTADLVKETSS
ncbi:MAG: prepilin-type N-terminal cleavage/methylation domain-containing protein [Roseimicrobium sp.]